MLEERGIHIVMQINSVSKQTFLFLKSAFFKSVKGKENTVQPERYQSVGISIVINIRDYVILPHLDK